MNRLIKLFMSLGLVAGLLLSANGFAAKRPAVCPNAQLIKAGGLIYTNHDEDGYLIYQISNYGTPTTWVFGIGDIEANNPAEAVGIAYQTLATVYGSPTPIYIAEQDVWACFYGNNTGLMSIAFTLPVGQFSKAVKLKAASLAK